MSNLEADKECQEILYNTPKPLGFTQQHSFSSFLDVMLDPSLADFEINWVF